MCVYVCMCVGKWGFIQSTCETSAHIQVKYVGIIQS